MQPKPAATAGTHKPNCLMLSPLAYVGACLRSGHPSAYMLW
jgi:hypothetical protein